MSLNKPYVLKESSKNIETALEDLKKSVSNNGFNVIHIHDMKDTFEKHGFTHDEKYYLVEICKPEMSHQALQMDKKMGMMMPKKIILYEDNGNAYFLLQKVNPDSLTQIFPNLPVKDLSLQVMQAMEKIIQDSIH